MPLVLVLMQRPNPTFFLATNIVTKTESLRLGSWLSLNHQLIPLRAQYLHGLMPLVQILIERPNAIVLLAPWRRRSQAGSLHFALLLLLTHRMMLEQSQQHSPPL